MKGSDMRIENDWARYSYKSHQHYLRYKRRVEARKPRLTCQECRGEGSYVEDSIDFGDSFSGPLVQHIYSDCGYCRGTGLLTAFDRGQWLRWKKMDAKEKREYNARNTR